MVCLKADEWELCDALKEKNAAGFRDEDLDDMLTAVAIGPLTRERGREVFGHLSLA